MENVMKPSYKILLPASLFFAVSVNAMAQPHEFIKACGPDIKTHCANIEKGEGRIAECMRQNQDKLSDDCKAKIEELRSKMKDRRGNRAGPGSAAKGK
jgi:hypothetical protein